jgi:hypothetical protein
VRRSGSDREALIHIAREQRPQHARVFWRMPLPRRTANNHVTLAQIRERDSSLKLLPRHFDVFELGKLKITEPPKRYNESSLECPKVMGVCVCCGRERPDAKIRVGLRILDSRGKSTTSLSRSFVR